MTKREFIRENKDLIDDLIRSVVNDPTFRINNDERELWILNDEYLYRLARRSGVKI